MPMPEDHVRLRFLRPYGVYRKGDIITYPKGPAKSLMAAGAVELVRDDPQLLEVASQFTGWTPPFVPDLPRPVNTVLTVGGVLAALDRALRRRYHPLLDG